MSTPRKELENLIKAGILPVDFDVKAELVRLAEEKLSSQKLQVWREIRDAYGRDKQSNGRVIASPVQTYAICGLIVRWVETHDKSFVEAAIEYCFVNDLPVLQPIIRELVVAIHKDRDGQTAKPLREGIADKALNMICNLVIGGTTLRRASEVAALWTNQTPHQMKASTLEKRYTNEWRSGEPSLEKTMRDFQNQFPDPESDAAWQQIEKNALIPSDEQKGQRR